MIPLCTLCRQPSQSSNELKVFWFDEIDLAKDNELCLHKSCLSAIVNLVRKIAESRDIDIKEVVGMIEEKQEYYKSMGMEGDRVDARRTS